LNPYKPSLAVIEKVTVENEAADIKTFKLRFRTANPAEFTYTCGQFAELSVFGIGECPIGIASSPLDRGFLEFTVKKVGTVSSALHEREEGEIIGIRGPYGNGFPMERLKGHNIVVIGGGFAFTTLRSLVKFLLDEQQRLHYKDVTVIYGARSPGELIYKYDLENWSRRNSIHVVPTVDRGDATWGGKVGFVPAVLKEVAPSSANALALVCGPPVMIRFTLPVLAELGFDPERILLSLEMRMKCGIGKCGRCNIGNKFVCKDGPVFTYKELQGLPREY